jgi:hypothetical protein
MVQWFTADGKMSRQLARANVDVQPGFVWEHGAAGTTIHPVNGAGQIALPVKPGPASCVTSTEDGRTFVHEHGAVAWLC